MGSWERRIVTMSIIGILVAIIAIVGGNNLFETVEKGTYQIKQAAVSGQMSAKMDPGLWVQLFGDIQTWPKAETFFFTKDVAEGAATDQSIEVRFNDGSLCDISGTMRIQLPTSEVQAINLVTAYGYKSYRDLEARLILPVTRNALRLTANLMSARESYQERRADFTYWAWDQIQNGMYETEEYNTEIADPITGEKTVRTLKRIKVGPDGAPIRQSNPLDGLGITLSNFEIKAFEYADKVKEQIATQQDALMAVATAAARAKKAEQERRTAEAEGQRQVMMAKYEKEQDKIRAVVDAEQKKQVAIVKAEGFRETAKLAKEQKIIEAEASREQAKIAKEAAEFYKQEQILRGEGEAKRRQLVMQADGALDAKLEAYKFVMANFAKEFGKQKWVPEVSFGPTTANGSAATSLIDLLQLQALQSLGLDVRVNGASAPVQ